MINTILEFLEEWSFFAPLLITILAFCVGYFGRMYEEKSRVLYSFTEEELNNVYRKIWDKARYLGKTQAPFIHTKEWRDSMAKTHIYEAIDEERKSE